MKHCPACHRCYDDAQATCAEDHSTLVESRPGSPLLAGKYRLEEFLGRGDQGTAYEATALADGRSVIAVELLRAEVLDDPQALARFHSAAQAAGRNNGQEVGEIRDSGPLPGGGAYVVMGLMDEEADGPVGAATAPEPSDTPTVAAKSLDTGRLHQPGRTTGRLSKVGVEITQELRRIPVPLPPAEGPRPAAAEEPAPFKDAGVTRVVDARKRPQEDSSRHVDSGAAGLTPAMTAADAPRRARPRRRRSGYLGLALIGLACGLLLAYAFTRMRRESEATAVTPPDATQSQAPKPSPTDPPAAQQTAAPASGQTGPAAVTLDGASPAATAGRTATDARSSPQGAGRESDVREVLDDWRAAAVSRNVDRLMGFYAPELEIFHGRRDVTSSSLRAELTRLYGRAEKVEARILGEPRLTFEEGGRTASARVRLGYTVEDKGGKVRRGEVTQQLRLVKTGGGWKISSQRGQNMLR